MCIHFYWISDVLTQYHKNNKTSFHTVMPEELMIKIVVVKYLLKVTSWFPAGWLIADFSWMDQSLMIVSLPVYTVLLEYLSFPIALQSQLYSPFLFYTIWLKKKKRCLICGFAKFKWHAHSLNAWQYKYFSNASPSTSTNPFLL